MPDKQSATITLYKFFGFKNVRECKAETDKLSEEEKVYLAQMAAREMGLSQDAVSFPLSQ